MTLDVSACNQGDLRYHNDKAFTSLVLHVFLSSKWNSGQHSDELHTEKATFENGKSMLIISPVLLKKKSVILREARN